MSENNAIYPMYDLEEVVYTIYENKVKKCVVTAISCTVARTYKHIKYVLEPYYEIEPEDGFKPTWTAFEEDVYSTIEDLKRNL